MIGYIAGTFSHLKMRFKNIYNIAIHGLTLPIILNLVYIIINVLTGYTIKYFSIMYMAIACIYVITAILVGSSIPLGTIKTSSAKSKLSAFSLDSVIIL